MASANGDLSEVFQTAIDFWGDATTATEVRRYGALIRDKQAAVEAFFRYTEQDAEVSALNF